MRKPLLIACLACLSLGSAGAGPGVAVIAHPGTPKMDQAALRRLFMGRLVEVNGVDVIPVNQRSGTPARGHFLETVVGESEDKYIAYWTVRRYIGKGAPPRELANDAEVVSWVQSTPGAVGYISEESARPGLDVLLVR